MPADEVKDHEYQNGAGDGDANTRQIDACDALEAESLSDRASNQSPRESEENVANQSFPRAVHDLASREATDETDYQPSNYPHSALPVVF